MQAARPPHSSLKYALEIPQTSPLGRSLIRGKGGRIARSDGARDSLRFQILIFAVFFLKLRSSRIKLQSAICKAQNKFLFQKSSTSFTLRNGFIGTARTLEANTRPLHATASPCHRAQIISNNMSSSRACAPLSLLQPTHLTAVGVRVHRDILISAAARHLLEGKLHDGNLTCWSFQAALHCSQQLHQA
jgi:hypothetical protein